jgi:hypothetical protein
MNSQTLSALLVLILVFIVCRELVCWYWKINKTVDVLENILSELKQVNGKGKDIVEEFKKA